MTRKPAIGPAIPISKNWRFDAIGCRILITAPSVPGIGTGNGSHNGMK